MSSSKPTRWRFLTWTSDQVPAYPTMMLDVTAHVAASIVPAVLDVLGQRWSLAIIQALLFGEKSFGQLLQDLNIPRSTLAARLKHLQAMGCLQPASAGYRLTESGQALLPIAALAQAWDSQTSSLSTVATFMHSCGRPYFPVLVCQHCSQPIQARDIQLGLPGAPPDLRDMPIPVRRSRAEFSTQESLCAADILGDRWTAMIIALGFYGVHRYSDLARYLAIAPNILADRLQRLCEGEVLLREGSLYRFTERGLQLFPLIIALSTWGDSWLRKAGQLPTQMQHLTCDRILQPEMQCVACGQAADRTSLVARPAGAVSAP